MTEQTATTEPRAATAQAGEMKISISLKGQKAMIGIATAQCDPLWFQLEGLLEEVVARIPGLVALARERCQTQAKYPVYSRPAPPPAPPRTTPQPRAGSGGSQAKEKTVKAPKLFE